MIGHSQRRRFVLPAAVCAGFLGLGSQAHAVVLVADALGTENTLTAGYWGVAAASGSGYVSSVSIDLSADFGAFFDFDGEGNFGNALGPVLSSLVGLTEADISVVFGDPVAGIATHPAVLTFNFAPGSFAAGDSFRFGADTEFFVSDPTPGGAIGSGGGIFSVTLETGQSGTAAFSDLFVNRSISAVTIQTTIPEPSTLVLLAIGVVGLGVAKRRTSFIQA